MGADGLPMPCSRRDRRASLMIISDDDFDSIFEQLNKVEVVPCRITSCADIPMDQVSYDASNSNVFSAEHA